MNSMAAAGTGQTGADVLVMVDDPMILASVRRVAAAIDQAVDEAMHPVSRQQWNRASAVVLDAASARACSSRNPRRSRVFIVNEGEPTIDEWKYATSIGAQSVFTLPADENALVAVLAEHSASRGDGTVVAVVGGCGGAGASVSAAAIALTSAARHTPTLLVDVDALGSGADVLLGIDSVPGLRWSALTVEGGRLSPEALRDALPALGKDLRVLACSRREVCGPSVTAVAAVLDAGRRSGGVVVCDVPRDRSPVVEAVLEASDFVVMVVPATVASCVAAEKVGVWAAEHNSNIGLLVRGPAPGGLRGVDVANMLGLPLIAVMRGHRSLASMLERGGLELTRHCPLSVGSGAVLDAITSGARIWGTAA
ncbi:septum site-determining protein Ssd [Rhodococcus sp. OK302]|uniref:septum site-determining protein Ssd n=1 Tax=Rhodococcus sp. OK302 TaxID=1882769 RepID=UPI000B9F0737|nr:septum site-determining protein Ssd [Rhodococcus sp. OK302]OYD67794.1 secretion/DNA translocation related CpaE-like protein [Rhodococcus sp. OK302]